MAVEMTPSMEAAAMLGIAERECRLALGQQKDWNRAIAAFNEYARRVTELLEAMENDG